MRRPLAEADPTGRPVRGVVTASSKVTRAEIRTFRLLRLPRPVVVFAVIGAATGALAVLPAAGLLQRAIQAATQRRALGHVAGLALAAAAVQVIGTAVTICARLRASTAIKTAVSSLRMRLIEAQLATPLLDTRGVNPALPQFTILADTERLDAFAEQLLGTALPGAMLLVTSLLYVGFQDAWLAGGLVVVGLPLLVLSVVGHRCRQWKRYR